MFAMFLMTTRAGILLLLGSLHLFYTFSGPMLRPRDPALQIQMATISPGITRDATMWEFWMGFNVSHSMAVMLFGLIYGFLAIFTYGPAFLVHLLAGSRANDALRTACGSQSLLVQGTSCGRRNLLDLLCCQHRHGTHLTAHSSRTLSAVRPTSGIGLHGHIHPIGSKK